MSADVPADLVEAAARAMHEDDLVHDRAAHEWDEGETSDWYRDNAQAALASVLPRYREMLLAVTEQVVAATGTANTRETLAGFLAEQEWPDLTWQWVKNHSTPERFYARADAVLASRWLAERDASMRETLLGPIRELVDEAERRKGRRVSQGVVFTNELRALLDPTPAAEEVPNV